MVTRLPAWTLQGRATKPYARPMQGSQVPDGKASASVYWRRRALVLVILCTLLGLIVWGIAALVHGRQRNAAATEAVTAQVQQSRPTRSPAATPTPAPLATAGPPKACNPAKLTLAISGATAAKSGEKEEFSLAVTNGGAKTCILAITGQNAELVITSGNDTIWTSKDCWATVGDKNGTVDPGKGLEWKAAWETKRSVGSCELSPQKLGAGTYLATWTVSGATPVQQRFELT